MNGHLYLLSGFAPVEAAVDRLRVFVKRSLSVAPQHVGRNVAAQGEPGSPAFAWYTLFAPFADANFADDSSDASLQGSNPISERSRWSSHTVKRRCAYEST